MRVSAGTFHAFHLAWIADLQRTLNDGLLPPGYYALAAQVANPVVADVLTLQGNPQSDSTRRESRPRMPAVSDIGGIAVAEAPPRVTVRDSISESMLLAALQRKLVIRHMTGDRIVALMEIVSPGNKEKRSAVDVFVDKAVAALETGYHLLIADLFPPGSFDPTGIHGAIWKRLGGDFTPPPGRPLTLAGYASGGIVTCYVEPTSVGSELIPMPLFLDPEHYINVPLEDTYMRAYQGIPGRWKQIIEDH